MVLMMMLHAVVAVMMVVMVDVDLPTVATG